LENVEVSWTADDRAEGDESCDNWQVGSIMSSLPSRTSSPGTQVSVARQGKGRGEKKRKEEKRKGGFTWCSDFVRHVGKEF